MTERRGRNGIRRIICAALCLCLLAGVSGCAGKKAEERAAAPALPPADCGFEAPDGDSVIADARSRIIYLPGTNDLRLIPRQVWMEPLCLTDTVKELMQVLLTWHGDADTLSLGGDRQLALYGEHPIEISGGICTVNLASSALQLSYRELYRACIAISTTLCEMDEISYVNILVAGQSVGMDITGSLPMGSLTAHPDENLPVLWEQMEARRTPLGEDLSSTSVSALVTLYEPLMDGAGIGCENRIWIFGGQTPQQLASGLIQAMDEAGSPDPSIRELLLHEPVISELEDGGRLITLSFRADTEQVLAEKHQDMACLMAAMTFTFTTFIPGIAAVCVRLEDKPVTELRSETFGKVTVLGGLLQREMFEPFLRGDTTVFLARGETLWRCEHPINRTETDSPRAQLTVLLEGPTGREREEGLEPTLPDTIREDDILGISAEGDTLLVNLSESFRSEIQDWGAERESRLCYSMVNTLCENSGLRKVCFFFEGEQVEQIAGTVYWAGVFDFNPGLSDSGLG